MTLTLLAKNGLRSATVAQAVESIDHDQTGRIHAIDELGAAWWYVVGIVGGPNIGAASMQHDGLWVG